MALGIFVSHSWEEENRYHELVALLTEALAGESWIDCSIPRNRAIDLSNLSQDELDASTNEVHRLEARLNDPGLPDAVSRVVWDAHGNRREMETYATVYAEYRRAVSRRNELLRSRALTDVSSGEISKGIARNVRVSPELSLAIRERIVQADVVMLLVTPMCLFRSWIDFELELASRGRLPVFAVLAHGTFPRELEIRCGRILNWSTSQISEALSSLGQPGQRRRP